MQGSELLQNKCSNTELISMYLYFRQVKNCLNILCIYGSHYVLQGLCLALQKEILSLEI